MFNRDLKIKKKKWYFSYRPKFKLDNAKQEH